MIGFNGHSVVDRPKGKNPCDRRRDLDAILRAASRFVHSWLCLGALAVLPAPALADTLMLDDAVRSALAHNPGLQAISMSRRPTEQPQPKPKTKE